MSDTNGRDHVNDLLSIPAIRRMFAAQAAPAEQTRACLDDDTLAALAEGTLTGEAHDRAVTHLAGCARCRGIVVSVARAIAAPAVAREARRVEHAGRRRLYGLALPLAAAAAVTLLVVRPVAREDGASLHRAPTITAAPAPVPVAPVGVVRQARVLRWSAVPSTDRYRVTLFDADASVLYEAEVSTTSAALPESVVLIPGVRYLWKVEARTGFDRWSASDLVDFSVARSRPR